MGQTTIIDKLQQFCNELKLGEIIRVYHEGADLPPHAHISYHFSIVGKIIDVSKNDSSVCMINLVDLEGINWNIHSAWNNKPDDTAGWTIRKRLDEIIDPAFPAEIMAIEHWDCSNIVDGEVLFAHEIAKLTELKLETVIELAGRGVIPAEHLYENAFLFNREAITEWEMHRQREKARILGLQETADAAVIIKTKCISKGMKDKKPGFDEIFNFSILGDFKVLLPGIDILGVEYFNTPEHGSPRHSLVRLEVYVKITASSKTQRRNLLKKFAEIMRSHDQFSNVKTQFPIKC